MDIITTDIQTLTFIQGDTEFYQACKTGFWKNLFFQIIGRNVQLDDFNQVIGQQRVKYSRNLGVQDIAISLINGSVDRSHDFTRDFAPRATNQGAKDRWRIIYGLAVTGKGFPPIELYKIGSAYFVKDGHHRISVTAHLGWPTIQAQVTELFLTCIDRSFNTVKGVNLCVS